jgi:hypothetical protein
MEGGGEQGSSYVGYLNLFCKFEVTSCVVRPSFHLNFCDSSFFAIIYVILVGEYGAICAISFFLFIFVLEP